VGSPVRLFAYLIGCPPGPPATCAGEAAPPSRRTFGRRSLWATHRVSCRDSRRPSAHRSSGPAKV